MTLTYALAKNNQGPELAEIRVKAMRPSLETLNRFDPERARSRFMDTFSAENTTLIMEGLLIIGFYVVIKKTDYLWLDHLYVLPSYQNKGIGKIVLTKIKESVEKNQKPLRLGALRDSPANAFYVSQGFVKTHEEEWDIYYQLAV